MAPLSIIWKVGDLLLATDVESVVEVLPPVASWPAPGVPSWIRGLFSYRGQLLPLVDASRLLDLPARPDRMANRVAVLRCSPAPGARLTVTGVWVDAVIDISRIDFSTADSHPGFVVDAGRYLGPVAQTRFGFVQRLQPEGLFTAEQAAVLAERLKEAAA